MVGNASTGIGVHGTSTSGDAVAGETEYSGNGGNFTANGDGSGVLGTSAQGTGGTFVGATDGVSGTTTDGNYSGVRGANTAGGNGVYGTSVSGNAVAGKSEQGNAGYFTSQNNGDGVYASSVNGNGVHGHSTSGLAGYFEGDCTVTGDQDIKGTLTVQNPIQVAATSTPAAFVYTVSQEDLYPPPAAVGIGNVIEQSLFKLDHPSLNSKPNAVIFITQLFTQTQTQSDVVSYRNQDLVPSLGVKYGVGPTGYYNNGENDLQIEPVTDKWFVMWSPYQPTGQVYPYPDVPGPYPWPIGAQFHVLVLYR